MIVPVLSLFTEGKTNAKVFLLINSFGFLLLGLKLLKLEKEKIEIKKDENFFCGVNFLEQEASRKLKWFLQKLNGDLKGAYDFTAILAINPISFSQWQI